MIEALDHINIRTNRLDEMVTWYRDVLGLASGPRPDFGFPGAWLYAGAHAAVHLVATSSEPTDPGQDLRLEHGAFRAKGLKAFRDLLAARGERFELRTIEDFGILQVNVWDPDGNHLHVDFSLSEMDG